MMKRALAILAVLTAIGACSGEQSPPGNGADPVANGAANQALSPNQPASSAAPQATPVMAIEGEGLRLFNRDTGAARPIPFGTARDQVMAALAFRGQPDIGTLEECGAGPLDRASWPDGLTLYFQDAKFAGWALDRRGNDGGNQSPITTAAGIAPGSARSKLEAAYAAKIFESTLGTEFAAGDLFGLLDGRGATARITDLWAGASCNMR